MRQLPDPRHEKYAQEIAQGKPRQEAYALAGYKKHRGNSNRLANRPEVRERVRWLQLQAADLAQVNLARVVTEVSRVGFANIQQFYKRVPAPKVNEPNATKLVLKDLDELTPEQAMAIDGLEHDGEGRLVLKLRDRNQALFQLMRHLGGLPEPERNIHNNLFALLSPDDQRRVADFLEGIIAASADADGPGLALERSGEGQTA